MSAMMIAAVSFSHSLSNARLHCSHGNHTLVLHSLMMQSSSDLGVCAAPQSIINIGGAPSRTMSLVRPCRYEGGFGTSLALKPRPKGISVNFLHRAQDRVQLVRLVKQRNVAQNRMNQLNSNAPSITLLPRSETPFKWKSDENIESVTLCSSKCNLAGSLCSLGLAQLFS